MKTDANGTVLAFADMMRKQMVMPAHLMKDGQSPTLFRDYSEVGGFKVLDFYAKTFSCFLGLLRSEESQLPNESKQRLQY